MKVYVISDSTEYGLAAANQINAAGHVAIMSESITNDARTQLSDLRTNISSGFDIIMIICSGAKDLSISANKIGGAMAVVCKDREDALEAISSTRANVILIDSSKIDRRTVSSIINGLLSEQGAEQKSTQKRQTPSKTVEREVIAEPAGPGVGTKVGSFFSGIKDKASDAASSIGKPSQPAIKPKNMGRPQSSGDGAISSIKKKGLTKSLKDAFGIIDDK